jgi:hypothetical protein
MACVLEKKKLNLNKMFIRYKRCIFIQAVTINIIYLLISTLKMGAVHSSEMVVNYYHSTERHLTKELIFRYIFMRQDVVVTVTNVRGTDKYRMVRQHARKSKVFVSDVSTV